MQRLAQDAARVLLVALAYYLTGLAGLSVAYIGSNVTLLWPPTGISVAALVRFGPHIWPGVWLGALAVNLQTAPTPWVALAISVGNTLGPLVAQRLLTRAVHFDRRMHRTRDVWSLLTLGVVVPMMLPALGGAASLAAYGAVPWDQFAAAWVVWWLGDAVGVLLVAPPLLCIDRPELERLFDAKNRTGFVLTALSVLAFAAVSFSLPYEPEHLRIPLAFVVFAMLAWSALRWGVLGGSVLCLGVAVAASIGTALGRGPFAFADRQLDLSLLWAFLATTSLTSLLLIALQLERDRVETSLRESERRLGSILGTLPGVVYRRLDPLGEVVEFVSAKASVSWDIDPMRLRAGHPCYAELIHPDDLARVRVEIERAVAEQRPYLVEYRLRPTKGRELWVADYGDAQRTAQGSVVAYEGIVFDHSQRKELEGSLREAQKLEAIGRLAGGIAHDFNNMLAVILGYAEMIRDGSAESDPRHDSAAQIIDAGERAAELTRQLLAYGRKQLMQPVVLCESEVIRGMTRMLDRLIGANTTLVSELAAERNVRADPSQIEQMVMNLVLNAADAMPAGGVIRLETRDVSFERDAVDRPADLPPGDYVVLSVSDRGVGMDEATRTRIFEPFFTTKGLGKGTGLGLSTVYGIVKQSLGHITVDSALGRGTTLRIYLPAVDEPRTPAAKPKLVSVGPGRGETLLLVEDNKTVRTLIAEATSAQGYALVAVDGVRAALRALEQEPSVALVICDVALGDGTGPELVERVRASHPALPVLFISGHAQDAISPAVLADPHVAFLPKPFSLAVLEAKVRETLDAAAAAQATRTRMRA